MPEWVQSKITLATDYIQTAADYMYSEIKESVEQIDELSNATLRGYADKARTDIQKTLPKLHTDAKAAGRIDKRVAGLAASTVAKVKNNMKKESVEQIDEVSLKTASSAFAKRIGQSKPSSQDKALQTIRHIAKKHGASGVATAAKTAEKEAIKKIQQEEVEQKHKEIDTHTEVEDGSHQDKNDTKDLHDRIKAAAKKHGATITYQDKPSLRGSHTISARGSQNFHKEVKHIASDYEHLGVQHDINEEVEHLNEDDGLKSIAKKHGMEYHPGTYGANMSHAKKGFVNINRYGEWSHHKQGRFDRGHGPATAHGDSSQNFKDLDKHLGTLKEEYEQIHEISDKLAGDYLKKVNDKLIKKVGMKPDLYNHLEPKRQKGATRALNRLMKPVEEGTSADSDGGPPTPAASTLTVTGQPKLTKTVGQTKMIPYVHEEKETKPPFDKPYTTTKAVVKDKSGAKHTPMSRARDLARKAMARKMEEQSNIEPNPFTIPSSNPGDAPEKKVKKASPVAPTAMAESRQLEIVREAMKVAKKKKEVTEAGTDKFIADPELSSQITKSNP
jgi:hypothetical protein